MVIYRSSHQSCPYFGKCSMSLPCLRRAYTEAIANHTPTSVLPSLNWPAAGFHISHNRNLRPLTDHPQRPNHIILRNRHAPRRRLVPAAVQEDRRSEPRSARGVIPDIQQLTAPTGKPVGFWLPSVACNRTSFSDFGVTSVNLFESGLLLPSSPTTTLAVNFCFSARTDSQSPNIRLLSYFDSAI